MRKVHEVEKQPSGDGKEAKVKEALFGKDGLKEGSGDAASRAEVGDLSDGEAEQRVRDAAAEEEDRVRRRDQREVQVDG